MPRTLLHLLQGLAMGTADSVPGVSGGTVALIVGIYGRLLASIGHGFRAILALARLDVSGARTHLRGVEWTLVAPLAVGIATAIVIAARFVPALLENRPVESRAFFLGLVVASLAVPWAQIRDRTRRSILIAVAAALPAFVLSGLPPAAITDPRPLIIFLGAAVAVSAMILPGVSGSYLLLVVGLYEPTLRAVDDRNFFYIGIFVVGMVMGLGSFSLLLGRLLAKYHDVTMAVLVGLMAGSLRALWPWQTPSRGLQAPSDAGLPLVLILLGAAIVIGMQVLTRVRSRQSVE
jgi:putative membrane protein